MKALDQNGNPAKDIIVTVVSLTENGKVVFQGKTNQKGQVPFVSSPAAEVLSNGTGPVVDSVYEVYFAAPNGEVHEVTVAVPHVKDKGVSDQDRSGLEQQRTKELQVSFTGETPKAAANTLAANTVTLEGVGCTQYGYGGMVCVDAESIASHPTRIGKVNVGNGETVDFKLTEKAEMVLGVGLKSEGGGWSSNNSITLTAYNKTTVGYTFNGTCAYVSGVSTCNLGRYIFASCEYLYQQKSYYLNGTLINREYTVTPTRLLGSDTTVEWFYDANNGQNPSSSFTIGPGTSTDKEYSQELNISLSATIPTPVGACTISGTTKYTTSHSITWSSKNGGYYRHYDLGTNSGMWWVATQ